MTITLRGSVEQHSIKLPDWVHIPEGTKVKVSIEAEISKEDKKSLASSAEHGPVTLLLIPFLKR